MKLILFNLLTLDIHKMKQYQKIDQPNIQSLLFQPSSATLLECPVDAEDIPFEVDTTTALTCRFYFAAKEAPTLLYFYDGNESISAVSIIAEGYQTSGVNVFVVSMRGYDGNPGTPSLATLLSDSKTLFPLVTDWLAKKEYSGALFVLGRSIGSICAMEAVLDNEDAIKGMIIESAINATIPYLQAIGVDESQLDFLEEDGFDIITKIEKIKIPTMILHGARDTIVPIDQAENLQSCSGARSKQFFVIPGADRDNLVQTAGPLYYQTMKKFFDTVCGVNTWRGQRKKYKKSKRYSS